MVGCSRKPQNFESMLDLNETWSDFTKVWSRENYDHQDCSPGRVPSRDQLDNSWLGLFSLQMTF